MFELYYLPIHLELGQEQPDMPGMVVKLPPRKGQRSRAGDILIALLTPFEGTHPGARTLESMLEEAADLYYKSRGSVTSGLRAAADHLNYLFLKYNAHLQGNRKDGQIFAYLNLAVLRDNLLYIVHVGSTSTYLLSPDKMQPFRTDSTRGRGLGISRSAPISYFQASVDPESMLLLCANPPASWAENTLAHGTRLTINLLRRRIVQSSGVGLRAGMVQFKPAEQAAVHRLRPKSPETSGASEPFEAGVTAKLEEEVSDRQALTDDLVLTPETLTQRPEEDAFDQFVPSSKLFAEFPEETSQTPPGPTDEMRVVEERPVPHVRPTEPTAGAETAATSSAGRTLAAGRMRSKERLSSTQAAPPVRRKREPAKPDPVAAYQRAARRQASRKKMAAAWQDWRSGWARLANRVRSMFVRLLPGVTEDSPQISGGWMLFISFAVPLLVVTAAITVYLRNGRDQQHQMFLQQAQGFAAEARQDTDPEAERSNWNQVFHWLDLAEEYRISEDSDSLRRQASAALDVLDGVERLEFNSLMPLGFSSTLNFVEIAANDTEVYLLDSSQGRVLRLFLTGQGYEMDNEFACGPGASGTRLIGDLIDLIILPPGNPLNASVMAVDSNGNLLFCIPGASAPASGELLSPVEGWGQIQAMAYYQGALYVLDSLYGAVYTYLGYNMEFGGEPSLFFDPERDTTIPNLRQMIDLAAYGEDLYLLNENGTIAWCTSGIFEAYKTRCEDPASFGDMRPGMDEETPIFPNAFFAQIQGALPPDPSLFLLDVNTPSIYRFSLQLNLDRLFQPFQYSEEPLPQPPATAFTLSPSRVLFLAYGNEVVYAPLNR